MADKDMNKDLPLEGDSPGEAAPEQEETAPQTDAAPEGEAQEENHSGEEPSGGEEIAPPPVIKKRKKSFLKSKWFKWIVIILIIAALVSAYFIHKNIKAKQEAEAAATSNTAVVTRGDITVKITGSGTVEPIETYNIIPTVSGTIDADYYEEGDYVEEGAVLYRFDSTVADNAIRTAENSIKTAENGVKTSENSVKTSEISVKNAENAIKTAENGVKTSENSVKSSENSVRTSENSVKNAENAVHTAENAVKTAENAVTTSENSVAAAENTVERAEVELQNRADDIERAEENLEKLNIYANSDGKVGDLALTVGNDTSGRICTITDTSTLLVKIPFNSAQFEQIRVGDSVTVSIEKYMTTAGGKVTRKYNAAGTGSDGSVVYDVEIQINSGVELPAGTYVTASVNTGEGTVSSAQAGAVYYPDTTSVMAEYSGKVKEVLVKNGDWVKKGDLIARLSSTTLEDALKTAQQNYDNAERSLQEAQNSYENALINLDNSKTSLDNAKASLDNSQISLDNAQANYDNSLNSLDSARASLDNSKTSLDNSYSSLDTAKTNLDNSKTSLDNSRTSLDNAQTTLEDRKKDAEDYTITAPISGVIMSKDYKAGDTIYGQNSTTLMVIADMSKMKFTISVDELDISRIALGQEVEVTSDALEGVELVGYITNISQLGTAQNGVTNYPVEVTIDEPGDLMSGMNVSAEIVVGEVFDVIQVPVTAVSYFEGKHYVTVVGEVAGMADTGADGVTVPPGGMGRHAEGEAAGEGAPEGAAPEGEAPPDDGGHGAVAVPVGSMDAAERDNAAEIGGASEQRSGRRSSGKGGSESGNITIFDQEQRVEVEVGLSNDDYYEIKSGLRVGQVVRDNGTGSGSTNPFAMMMSGMSGMGGGPQGGGGGRPQGGGGPR